MEITTTRQQLRAFGERLKTEREKRGYSQQQIAQLLGIAPEDYIAHEKGLREMGVLALTRLQSVGLDAFFVLTGERFAPAREESELLQRFRELSLKGRTSIFMTLDALERLAPNLQRRIRASLAHD